MADPAKVPAQHIVRLFKGAGERGDDFVSLRRRHDVKTAYQWRRDAESGKIPGAFQFNGKGPWFVNLDVYDAEVQKLSAPKTPAPDGDVLALIGKLGLSDDDLQTIRRAGLG